MKRELFIGVLVLGLTIAFPLAMHAMDQQFYITFATRILIYAMAAASLNLVLGYGGMVSFGHAAFFGAGAYIVGILAVEESPACGSPGRRRSRWRRSPRS